jgi:hypothetical protein
MVFAVASLVILGLSSSSRWGNTDLSLFLPAEHVSNASTELELSSVVSDDGYADTDDNVGERFENATSNAAEAEVVDLGLSGDVDSNCNGRDGVDAETTTVVFLSRQLTPELLHWARLLYLKHHIDAHVIVDTPFTRTSVLPSDCVHYPPTEEVTRAGFTFVTGRFQIAVTAWDRALYWCYLYGKADFFWLIEDDVAWDSSDTLSAFMKYYDANSHSDLIARSHMGGPADSPQWKNWDRPTLSLPKTQLTSSFNPLCRLSRRMLNGVANMAEMHGRLAYNEFMFASLAKANSWGVTLFSGKQNNGIYIRYRPVFRDVDLQQLPLGPHIIHPVKHRPNFYSP